MCLRLSGCCKLPAASALKCGVHWPMHQPSSQALARSGGSATALHNNCSGKHAGFLCVACAMGAGLGSYIEATHPVQREIKTALENLTGAPIADEDRAIDGCSVPTWAVPLTALARGFARFGTGEGLGSERAKAAARLRAACAAKPWHVAGTGRFCTEVMQNLGARVFVKTGAEGVFCAALPEQGLGFAVKADDGGTRAAETIIAAALARFLPDEHRAPLQRYLQGPIKNWNGIEVGRIRAAEALGSFSARGCR